MNIIKAPWKDTKMWQKTFFSPPPFGAVILKSPEKKEGFYAMISKAFSPMSIYQCNPNHKFLAVHAV